MASAAIEFDKTLQERLDEYKEIFLLSSDSREDIPTCQKRDNSCLMKEFWGNHLSVVLYAKEWKAIWRVPIGKCILMDLKHPSNVLVQVISIDWENLSADVQVLKINEHYVPSSKRIATLCDLYPIEEQTTDYDPWLIANELDKYRFFNEYLWYPWDDIEDDIYTWTEIHLEQRMQLLYDIVVGEVNSEDSDRMRHLICDARHLQVEFEEIGRVLEELEDSHDLKEKDVKDTEELNANLHQMYIHEQDYFKNKDMLMVRLLFIKRKLKEIQHEFEALEDPVLRKAMANVKLRSLKREYQINCGEVLNNNLNEDKKQKEEIRNVALVCDKTNFKEIREFLDYAESKFSDGANSSVEFFYNLQVALDLVNSKRTSYLIAPGIHFMKSTEDFISPGTNLAGFPEEMVSKPSVIRGHSLGRTLMVVDWENYQCLPPEKQESAYLENLHFDPLGIEAVFLLDCGSVCMKFCAFSHEEGHCDLPVIGANSTPSTSILPTYSHHDSAWSKIKNGCGDGLGLPLPPLPVSAAFECPKQRGIAVGAHGYLEAKDCYFEGLHLAVIAYSGAKVTLTNCRFSKCHVAIRISKGAEVKAESCIFEHSLANSIQFCAGIHEEQDEEIQKIMEGKEEVITSSQILQSLPGVTFKECIFISGENADVCLRSVGEIGKSPKPEQTTSIAEDVKLIEEKVNESLVLWMEETEEDSVIILSDDD